MMTVAGCQTKKVLKSKIGQDAACVLVETSMFGPELRANGAFAVVGPSAYSRKWYAEVTVADGRITKVS